MHSYSLNIPSHALSPPPPYPLPIDTLNTVASTTAGTFGLTRHKVEKQQRHLIQSLDDEKASVQASMAALRALSLETIKMQYAMLPSRYLLLVEGG